MTRKPVRTLLIISMAGVIQHAAAGDIAFNLLAGERSLKLGSQGVVQFPASAFRTDLFYIDNGRFNFSPALGVLYRVETGGINNSLHQYLHDLSMGINLYYTQTKRSGSVYEYSLRNFNNSTYDMKVKNYRLMLDMEWTFQPVVLNLMPFVEAGLGGARNTMRFSNTPRPDIGADGGNYELANTASKAFAYEFGLGVKRQFGEKILGSFRYLYSDSSQVKSSRSDPMTGVRLALPIQSGLQSHALYLGFSYFCG